MKHNPAHSYFAGIITDCAINQTSKIQALVMYYLYHKPNSASSAILHFINRVDPDTPLLRTQSAVSHCLTELKNRNFIAFNEDTKAYENTDKGYRFVALFVNKAYRVETRMSELLN